MKNKISRTNRQNGYCQALMYVFTRMEQVAAVLAVLLTTLLMVCLHKRRRTTNVQATTNAVQRLDLAEDIESGADSAQEDTIR